HGFTLCDTATFSTSDIHRRGFYVVTWRAQQVRRIGNPIHLLLNIWPARDTLTHATGHTSSQRLTICMRRLIVDKLYQQIAEHSHQHDKDHEACVYTQKYTVFKHL